MPPSLAPSPRRSCRLASQSLIDAPETVGATHASHARGTRRTHSHPANGPNKRTKRSNNNSNNNNNNNNPSQFSCCICLSFITRRELSTVNSCRHEFCFACIAEWSKTQNKCPLCKQSFSNISRVHPVRQCSHVSASPNSDSTTNDNSNNNNNHCNSLDCDDRNELRPRRHHFSLTLPASVRDHHQDEEHRVYAIASQIFQEFAPMLGMNASDQQAFHQNFRQAASRSMNILRVITEHNPPPPPSGPSLPPRPH